MKKDTQLRLTFINVGYGEAIFIDAPDENRPDGRFYAMIDGGSAEDSEFLDGRKRTHPRGGFPLLSPAARPRGQHTYP